MAQAGNTGTGLTTEFRTVDPRTIEPLAVNAHFMPAEMYRRLVANIRRDGCLTSVPLCGIKEDGTLRCISGNHRVKASIEAGLSEIPVQVVTTPLTNDQFIALQLSHNALVGKDNEEILKVLWREMHDPDMKAYSGLDKAMVEKLELPSVPPIDMGLDFEQVTLLFVGSEKEYVRKVAVELQKRGILSRENWLETIEAYEQVVGMIREVCDREGIHNFATAIVLMAEYAGKYLKILDAGEVTPGTCSVSN
jgi:hypothetical protein